MTETADAGRRQTDRSRMAVAITAACAALLAVLCLIQPDNAFWITDGGNKFIITENLLARNSSEIRYPAADLDPEARFFPYADFHFRKTADGIRSFYPVYYPWLAAPARRLGGNAALLLLSAAAGLGCAWLAGRIARQLGFRPAVRLLTIPAVLFTTPLLFYSLVFWEHALAVCLATGGISLWLDEKPSRVSWRTIAAGALMGLSCVLREEGYVLLAAWGLAGLCCRAGIYRLAAWGAAAVAILLPLWIGQLFETGHILGNHALGYAALAKHGGTGGRILEKLSNLYVFLFQFDAGAPGAGRGNYLFILPAVAAVATGLRNGVRRFPRLNRFLQVTAIAGIAWLTWQLYRNPDPVINTLFTQGLFPGVPLLILLASSWPLPAAGDRRVKFLLTAAGFYLLILTPLLNQGVPGVLWGPRHFLILLPLLTPLALAGGLLPAEQTSEPAQRRLSYGILTATLLVGAAIQLQGVRTIMIKKEASGAIAAALLKQPAEVIVSDVFWLPEDCAAIFYRKKFMQVRDDRQLAELTELLRRRQIKSFALVLSAEPMFRRLSRPGIERLLREVRILQEERIAAPGGAVMTVGVFVCVPR